MRTALVTGAAARLGAAMARHLAARGLDLVIHYHQSAEAAEELAAALEAEFGVKARALAADLRDRDAVLDLMGRAAEALGAPVDVLINNASTIEYDRVDDAPSDDFAIWDANMRTNLEAPYFLTRSFADQCEGEGVVINMIDQRVWRLTPNYASYTLAKSALYTLTKTAAMALGPLIRVNAIGPGTTLQGADQPKENFELHRRMSVLERGADVEDILQALDYLLDARVVTGQMIAVDGGQHLIWQLPQG